jgi:hypothetical protein
MRSSSSPWAISSGTAIGACGVFSTSRAPSIPETGSSAKIGLSRSFDAWSADRRTSGATRHRPAMSRVSQRAFSRTWSLKWISG